MREINYIRFSGYITVTVDAVDLEQIDIEMPGLAHEPILTRAIAAAQRKYGFQKIQRAIMPAGFTLEPDDYKHGGGKVDVIFIAREMLRDSEVAA